MFNFTAQSPAHGLITEQFVCAEESLEAREAPGGPEAESHI